MEVIRCPECGQELQRGKLKAGQKTQRGRGAAHYHKCLLRDLAGVVMKRRTWEEIVWERDGR